MRFSFWIGTGLEIPEIVRRAKRAEETGWDGLWLADHFVPAAGDMGGPCHEVWTLLGALAQATEDIRLGSLVAGNTYRNPAVLMKQAVTVDQISNGRLVLGLGAGWHEGEHVAYGIEYGSFSDRFEKLEEALQMLLGLRSSERFSFAGDHYQLHDAPLAPKPIGPLPILIGGGGENKTLRMVAQYADEWNVWAEPELMQHKMGVLDAHCERLGRDPREIKRTAVALLFLCDTEEQAAKLRAKNIGRPSLVGTPEQLSEIVSEFHEMGVDELIVPDFNLGDGAGADDIADRFLSEVAGPFR